MVWKNLIQFNRLTVFKTCYIYHGDSAKIAAEFTKKHGGLSNTNGVLNMV